MSSVSIYITSSLSEMASRVSLSQIPGISNENYSVELKETEGCILILKESDGSSIAEMLNQAEQYQITQEEAVKARNYYLGLKRELSELEERSGNEMFQQLPQSVVLECEKLKKEFIL